ncbi:hypothetical protein PMAYCL1PPCAC_09354, partial [Pristionchus mayeri]
TLLKITKKEQLPKDTLVHQTADGTVFFNKYISPERLYVKFLGKEIDAQLPGQYIRSIAAHGNEIYFSSDLVKVYKASFNPFDGIIITYLRDKKEDEEFHAWGLCSRIRHGKTFAYRIWADPDKDGIIIDVPNKGMEGLKLVEIHRQFEKNDGIKKCNQILEERQFIVTKPLRRPKDLYGG